MSLPSSIAEGSTPTSGTEFFITLPPGLLGVQISTYRKVPDSNGTDIVVVAQDASMTDVGIPSNFSGSGNNFGQQFGYFFDPAGKWQVPAGTTVARLRVYVDQSGGPGTFGPSVPYLVTGR